MVQKYTYFEIFLGDLSKLVSLSEFEDYFKLPHQTIKRHLLPLVEEKVLIEERREKFLFFKLNLETPIIFDYISICEKQKLSNFLKKTVFRRLYEMLSEEFKRNKFLIFGSSVYSDKFNDIDLLIVGKNNENIKNIIREFEQIYSTNVHVILVSKKEMTNTFKKELIKKHIILNNHDFFVKLLYGEYYGRK